MRNSNQTSAFTLVELSIVLVIIGLIVGGVLVGRELVAGAEVRGQISQIEKYNSAVNAFKGKYGGLPGDLNAKQATMFGFTPRGTCAGSVPCYGMGDRNGVIEANCDGHGSNAWAATQGGGETILFWMDLSSAGLIDGSFANPAPFICPVVNLTATSDFDLSFPRARIGNGHYVFAYSNSGANYYAVTSPNFIWTSGGTLRSSPRISTSAAYNIDLKADDGLPQTGVITAQYLELASVAVWVGTVDTSATAASSNTCYDNGNIGGAVQKYSVGQNGGNNKTCALSFRFQ